MSNPVSVEIYTSSHRVLGRVTPGSAGLYGLMNDRTRSSIEIEGAHLTRLHQPARLVARYPKLWLNKRSLVAVLVSNRGELGSVSMTRHGYSTVVQHWVHLMLPGYELRGILEAAGRFDLSTIFVEGEAVFTPLYNAALQSNLYPNIDANSPAILFNAAGITAICPLRREDIPESSSDSGAA